MIWVDYVILSVIGLSALLSLFRGFVREVISLVSWITAFSIAWRFSPEVSAWLIDMIDDASGRKVVAFTLLFVATLISFSIVSYFVNEVIKKTGLSGTDRLLGMFFGGARGALIIGAIVMGFQVADLPRPDWWYDSTLMMYFEQAAKYLWEHFPVANMGLSSDT